MRRKMEVRICRDREITHSDNRMGHRVTGNADSRSGDFRGLYTANKENCAW